MIEKVCTFFGHRDCPPDLQPVLLDVLKKLIEQNGVTGFYLGQQGQFDAAALAVLKELKMEYPNICYTIVLSRLNEPVSKYVAYNDTIFPAELQAVPPRFAIDCRNRWMLRQADFVVTYVVYSWGGAARFADLANRQGKTVINLAFQDQ